MFFSGISVGGTLSVLTTNEAHPNYLDYMSSRMAKSNLVPISQSMSAGEFNETKVEPHKVGSVENLDDLLYRMEKLFSTTSAAIEAKIEASNTQLRTEISSLSREVQQFKAGCREEISTLSASVSQTRMEVRCNDERLDAMKRANDLLLSCVPYSPTEDLRGIIGSVAIALGYDEMCLPITFSKRLARLPIAAGTTPPILIQFSAKLARDDFYYRYHSLKTLSLQHLGFGIDKRIYLNENLSESARKIRKKALKLQKSGKLQNVFVKNGCVYIKNSMNSEAVEVHTLEQLPE